MSIIAFRTNTELEEKLQMAAKRQKKTRTEIIREALHFYLDGTHQSRKETSSGPSGRSAILKELAGIWDGPEDLSVDTGRKVGEYLVEKQRRRRL